MTEPVGHSDEPRQRPLSSHAQRRYWAAWEAGFWEGVEAARGRTFDAAMPEDWKERAEGAAVDVR